MWMGIFIAIFAGFGVPLSIITDNNGFIGIGPALGVAVGVAVGQSIENKYREQGKIRPLAKEEKNRKKIAVFSGIAVLVLGIIAFLLLYLIN